jgi:putative ABC transport system ATP-binding protein
VSHRGSGTAAPPLLRRFGLEPRAEHLPHRLSGGERQRVALARALANDPDVVFADEPTGSLDTTTGREVASALRAVADEGRTVVLVTHDEALSSIADARLRLSDGRLASVEVRGGVGFANPRPSQGGSVAGGHDIDAVAIAAAHGGQRLGRVPR